MTKAITGLRPTLAGFGTLSQGTTRLAATDVGVETLFRCALRPLQPKRSFAKDIGAKSKFRAYERMETSKFPW